MPTYLSTDPYAGVYEDAELQTGLRPGLLSAIAQQENVNPRHNNPLGLSTDSGVMSFSPEEATQRIYRQASLMQDPNGPYREFARTGDIGALAMIYAPPGASNDIHGTNATEASGIQAALDKRYISTDPNAGLEQKYLSTDPTEGAPEQEALQGLQQAQQAINLLTLPLTENWKPQDDLGQRITEGNQYIEDAQRNFPNAPTPTPQPEREGTFKFLPQSAAQIDIKDAQLAREHGPLVNLPQAEIKQSDPALAKGGKATYNAVSGLVSGLTSADGLNMLLNPVVGVAGLGSMAVDMVQRYQNVVSKTPPGSPERYQFAAEVGTLVALPAVVHGAVKLKAKPTVETPKPNPLSTQGVEFPTDYDASPAAIEQNIKGANAEINAAIQKELEDRGISPTKAKAPPTEVKEIIGYRGEPKGPSPAGSAHGVGQYYGLTPETAERFSRKGTVKQAPVRLENPLTIASDAELRQARESAGVTSDPRMLLSKSEAQAFTDHLKSSGYDGLIINYREAPGGLQAIVFPKAPAEVLTPSSEPPQRPRLRQQLPVEEAPTDFPRQEKSQPEVTPAPIESASGEYQGGTAFSPLGDAIRRRINTIADRGALKAHIEHPQKGLWTVINADTQYAYNYAKEQAAKFPDEAARYNRIVKAIETELPKIKDTPQKSIPLPSPEPEFAPQEPTGIKKTAIAEQREARDLPARDEPATTGIAQRVHEARFEAGKIGEVLPGTGLGPEALVEQGRAALRAGANPEAILAKVEHGQAVNAEEMGVLRARHEEMSKATDLAERQGDKAQYEAAFQAETDFARRIKPAATQASDVFRALQGETDIDTGTFTGLRRAVNDLHGRDIKPHEEPILKRYADRVQKANGDAVSALQRASENVERRVRPPKSKPRSMDELREHLSKRIKELTPC